MPSSSSTPTRKRTRGFPNTPSARKKRTNAARAAFLALKSPVKTVDTKDSALLRFKVFVKALADEQPPCERLCSDRPGERQVQYRTGTRDDGRYYFLVSRLRLPLDPW